MFKSTSKKARAFIATLVVLLGILASAIPGAVTPAQAYQVALNNAAISPGQAILSMPGSNLTTTYTIGGLTGGVGGARMDSRGYVASETLTGTRVAMRFAGTAAVARPLGAGPLGT